MNLNKLKISQGAMALLAIFLSGCDTDKSPIQFSDDHMATLGRRAENPAAAAAELPKQKLARPDLFKVDVAVYSYLLQRHFWDDGEYSAIFLQGDDGEVDALIKAFPNHAPPVKRSGGADLQPNRTPVDRETGKPAMILSVDTLDPEGDTVQAIGKWYAGGAVAGFYTFNLKKTGADWVVESAK